MLIEMSVEMLTEMSMEMLAKMLMEMSAEMSAVRLSRPLTGFCCSRLKGRKLLKHSLKGSEVVFNGGVVNLENIVYFLRTENKMICKFFLHFTRKLCTVRV